MNEVNIDLYNYRNFSKVILEDKKEILKINTTNFKNIKIKEIEIKNKFIFFDLNSNFLNKEFSSVFITIFKLQKKNIVYKIKEIKTETIFLIKKDPHVKDEYKNLCLLKDCFEDLNLFPKVNKIIDNNLILFFQKGLNLKEYLKLNPIIDLNIIKEWYFKLYDFIIQIHRMGLVHADIKLDNIIIGENNSIILIDWGFSKYEKKNENKNYKLCGTPRYLSPYLFSVYNQIYNKPKTNNFENEYKITIEDFKKSDSWALNYTFILILNNLKDIYRIDKGERFFMEYRVKEFEDDEKNSFMSYLIKNLTDITLK